MVVKKVTQVAAAPLVGVITMALLLVSAAWPDKARASFPGENGRFVFTWSLDRSGVGTDFLATASRTGADRDVLARCDYGCHNTSGDWSPSGHRLVYVFRCVDSYCQYLVKVAPDGSHRSVLREDPERLSLESPAWSPDGRRIAFIQSSDIYIISRDGTDLVRLTNTRRRETDLDWSSRNLLVFRSSRGRRAERRWELFTMLPNGQERKRLTNNPVPDSQPDWAPGGTRLTFVRGDEIWTMSATGENAMAIASGHSPTWAPDGRVIAFVSPADEAIHTVKPSGEDEALLGDPVSRGGIYELDWQPRSG